MNIKELKEKIKDLDDNVEVKYLTDNDRFDILVCFSKYNNVLDVFTDCEIQCP